MNLFNFFGKKTFPHGIHPEGFKEETHDHQTRRLPFPPQVTLPLAQSVGKPPVPIVHIGQHVQRGELIAKANGFMSVPLHASVTGTVKRIELVPDAATGNKEQAIIIQTSLSSSQIAVHHASQDFEQMSPEQLIQAIQDIGLVGLGGAAFPAHVKLNIPKEHKVHTVIVNGCECEPFMTTDHRVMLEQIDYMLTGIHIIMKAVGAEKAIIGIEDNKLNVIEEIKPFLPSDGRITIEAVMTKYPQGAGKMLVYSLLGQETPSGERSSSIGVIIYNVATLASLGELFPQAQGFIERVITITGDNLNNPGNYLVPIGTPLRYILEHAEFTGIEAELILGGPMMGTPVGFLNTPVKKSTGTVLVLDERSSKYADSSPCIKCSRCLQACPINLNPSELGLLAAKRKYDVMEEQFHLKDCFECGSCSYVCPSNIPLVQYFRIAKTLNKERHLLDASELQ